MRVVCAMGIVLTVACGRVNLHHAFKAGKKLELVLRQLGLGRADGPGKLLRILCRHAGGLQNIGLCEAIARANRYKPVVLVFLQQGSTTLVALDPPGYCVIAFHGNRLYCQGRIGPFKLLLHEGRNLMRIVSVGEC